LDAAGREAVGRCRVAQHKRSAIDNHAARPAGRTVEGDHGWGVGDAQRSAFAIGRHAVDHEAAIRRHVAAGVVDDGVARIGAGQGDVVANPERTRGVVAVQRADANGAVGNNGVARVVVRRAADVEHAAANQRDW